MTGGVGKLVGASHAVGDGIDLLCRGGGIGDGNVAFLRLVIFQLHQPSISVEIAAVAGFIRDRVFIGCRIAVDRQRQLQTFLVLVCTAGGVFKIVVGAVAVLPECDKRTVPLSHCG